MRIGSARLGGHIAGMFSYHTPCARPLFAITSDKSGLKPGYAVEYVEGPEIVPDKADFLEANLLKNCSLIATGDEPFLFYEAYKDATTTRKVHGHVASYMRPYMYMYMYMSKDPSSDGIEVDGLARHVLAGRFFESMATEIRPRFVPPFDSADGGRRRRRCAKTSPSDLAPSPGCRRASPSTQPAGLSGHAYQPRQPVLLVAPLHVPGCNRNPTPSSAAASHNGR